MTHSDKNCVVVLGPTASGKTSLGVRIARAIGGEIVSADSRQVYHGLDIGSGKDLEEYVVDGASIPYHLIDCVDLDHEFSVFEYQRRFFDVFVELVDREILPVVVGGTGLYLEAVLKGYRMVETPENVELRAELVELSDAKLAERLRGLKGDLHNVTDLEDRDRLIRAIEIADYASRHEPEPVAEVCPLIIGTRWDRSELHERIARRLRERLDSGLIEEVEGLIAGGVSTEKLHFLGLEYRHVGEFLEGTIKNRNDLFQKLNSSIRKFAKKQDTWFRRMERNGFEIEWVPNADINAAVLLVEQAFGEKIRKPGAK